MPVTISPVNSEEYQSVTASKVVFSQSTGWGNLRAQTGYRADYYLVYEASKLVGAFLVLVRTKRLASLKISAAYLPRPAFFFEATRSAGIAEVLGLLKQRYLLVVVEYNYPHWVPDRPDYKEWQSQIAQAGHMAGYISSDKHIQPIASIIKPVVEGDIYASLASKYARRDSRRGQHRADQLGISYEKRDRLGVTELKKVEEMMAAIADNRGFRTRRAPYLAAFQAAIPGSRWFTASHNDQLLSATLCVKDDYTNTDYSLYIGYHNPFEQELYLTYVSRVNILETLQKEHVGFYDQWGISEDPKSPLFKLSETKKRFGGDIIYYPKRLIACRVPGIKYVVRSLYK